MKTSRLPPLADTLRAGLPDASESLLLRAALSSGDRAVAAWAALMRAYPRIQEPFASGPPALRRLLPLLHHVLVENGIDVPEPTRAALRAATLWEERRAARIADLFAEIIDALRGAAIAPVLLKGFALAATAYPRPALRHCHDIDLLLQTDELARAAHALAPLGFTVAGRRDDRRAALTLVHGDGLPLSFHERLLAPSFYRLPEADMIAHAITHVIAGAPVRVLSPPDSLLHVCAHVAAGNAFDATSWVADAALLLRHRPLSDQEWRIFLETSAASGLSLPLFTMLRYAAEEIGAEIPARALTDLLEQARRTSIAARDTAVATARRGPHGRTRALIEQSGWRSRLELVRFLVIPSPTFLRGWCATRGLAWSPFWYLARPFRRLAIRAGAVRRLPATPVENGSGGAL